MENFRLLTAFLCGFYEHFSTFSTAALLKTSVFVMKSYENHKFSTFSTEFCTEWLKYAVFEFFYC